MLFEVEKCKSVANSSCREGEEDIADRTCCRRCVTKYLECVLKSLNKNEILENDKFILLTEYISSKLFADNQSSESN